MSTILLFIPMYNCEQQIGRVFAKITPALQAQISGMLVVDNRSNDRSREVAAQELKRFTDIKATLLENDANYNLGGSIKVAINYALEHGYDYLLVVHGDDQADPRDIIPLLENGSAFGSDLCIGARFHPDSRLQGYSLLRRLGNKALNRLLGLITHRRIDDMIAGLNLYRMELFRQGWYLGFPDNLTFDAHLLLYALHQRWRIHYFPISWREEDQVSNARIFRQGRILLGLFLGYALRGDAVLRQAHATPRSYTSQSLYLRS